MRRHTPTLYTHPELDSRDDDDWNAQLPIPQSYQHYPATSPGQPSSLSISGRARIKLRSRPSYSSSSSSGSNPLTSPNNAPSVPRYSDIYSQFVQRYRSGSGVYDDPRNDPDSHYFHRGLGQLVDAGESDDEDIARSAIISADGGIASQYLEADAADPVTNEDRERLEWQTMLASVLAGDVLKSEKTRIAVALESSAEEQNMLHVNIWLGVRARLHGRTEDEERKKLEERRLRTADAVINEIVTLTIEPQTSESTGPSLHTAVLKQVNAVLHRLDTAQSLYPNLKAFYLDKPTAAEPAFQARVDTLNTWSTVLTSIRKQINLLQRWTGSHSLDVSQVGQDFEYPAGSQPVRRIQDGSTEVADTSFVERILKEDSIQRTFEKAILTTVYGLLGTARDAQVNLAGLFQEMNLPTFEEELIPLISFPTRLAQACLRVRLAYAQKLKDPEVLIIDQMIDDLKISIGLACTLKRQYEAFLSPDPGGNWTLPSCIDKDYDLVVLEGLSFFFKLIHWKLKSGTKGIYFKETEVLEAQWATFNDVSLSAVGGASLVAEQLCALTNKLMVRVTNYFETQLRVPMQQSNGKLSIPMRAGVSSTPAMAYQALLQEHNGGVGQDMNDEQLVNWYSKILDSVRLRYRKLQRFARMLTQRFSNSAEYSLENVQLEHFIAALVDTDHCLVYTRTFEEEGTYIVAPASLRDRPDTIRRMLMEAFHVYEVIAEDGTRLVNSGEPEADEYEEAAYLLVISPRTRFIWNGLVLLLDVPKLDLDLRDNRIRLIADGAQHRLAQAKEQFVEIFMPYDDEGEPIETPLAPPLCMTEQQAHLPAVNRELRKIARATNRLAESIVDSVHHVRHALRGARGCQDLLENWYLFASEHGQHAQRHMDRSNLVKSNRLLIKLAISWVTFICDDCDPNDRKTFRWAVNALEFALHRTRRNNILQLPEDQFEMLRQKVASCMTLLISHFDILGARSSLAQKEKERQDELLRQQQPLNGAVGEEDDLSRSCSPGAEHDDVISKTGNRPHRDPSVRLFWEKATRALHEVESARAHIGIEQRTLGRVLDDEKPENRSLAFLASSSSNISIRWQQGRFIGAGAFGSVYLGVNLDSGSLMAVKEIKFQELSGLPNLYSQIKDELHVMEMLHHPNIVEYYGIEVHRDKVYIFEEYCQGGSLAALLEHGRIEDEGIMQVYTMQMLEGLCYLHSQGIVHRDIKPDNILLDHLGVIKFVDFGAAKVLARNQRSIQRTRRGTDPNAAGLPNNNSLTGTPMYMSPEMIKNDRHGRHGAMDVWSMGCVVLECATGKKPWSNLDNEWAIMFQIGVAKEHPPLPEPGQLSELGINFVKQCLNIDPVMRPTATELMNHPWMLEFRETLLSYEEAEMAAGQPSQMPAQDDYESATVARQAAIIQEKEVEAIASQSPSLSPIETPEERRMSPDPFPSPTTL